MAKRSRWGMSPSQVAARRAEAASEKKRREAEDAADREAVFIAMERMSQDDPDGFNQLSIRQRLNFAYWKTQRDRNAKAAT